jgi:ribonuclease BN (tRNA processing enzyme)
MGKQSFGEVKSYAYRFETPDRTIVFTGDTGPSDAVADLALGADILVSEVINIDLVTAFLKKTFNATDQHLQPLTEHMKTEHLIPNEVGKLAAKAGVKLLVLSHRAPSEDSERSWGPYINDVSQFYKGPVVAGQDLDQF